MFRVSFNLSDAWHDVLSTNLVFLAYFTSIPFYQDSYSPPSLFSFSSSQLHAILLGSLIISLVHASWFFTSNPPTLPSKESSSLKSMPSSGFGGRIVQSSFSTELVTGCAQFVRLVLDISLLLLTRQHISNSRDSLKHIPFEIILLPIVIVCCLSGQQFIAYLRKLNREAPEDGERETVKYLKFVSITMNTVGVIVCTTYKPFPSDLTMPMQYPAWLFTFTLLILVYCTPPATQYTKNNYSTSIPQSYGTKITCFLLFSTFFYVLNRPRFEENGPRMHDFFPLRALTNGYQSEIEQDPLVVINTGLTPWALSLGAFLQCSCILSSVIRYSCVYNTLIKPACARGNAIDKFEMAMLVICAACTLSVLSVGGDRSLNHYYINNGELFASGSKHSIGLAYALAAVLITFLSCILVNGISEMKITPQAYS